MLENLPLEFISNIVSFIIIAAIIIRFVKYKKRVAVIDGLYGLNQKKKLTDQDKNFITSNLNEYKEKFAKQEAFLKLMYPALILVAGIFLIFFEFAEAMIHINILVVTYIFLYIKKIHYRNYIKLLEDIKF